MNLYVYCAGVFGGHLAGRSAKDGADVSLIARPALGGDTHCGAVRQVGSEQKCAGRLARSRWCKSIAMKE